MIQEILEQKSISTVFQAIVDVQEQNIWGYEALSRGPAISPLHSPQALFAEAESQGVLTQLETVCILNASRQFQDLALPGKLFVNLSHTALIDGSQFRDHVLSFIDRFKLEADQVVIELTERSAADNVDSLLEAIQFFKQQGFEIAIDDLGAGYSTLRLWSEIRPDYVKIDRHFITDIDTDTTKQEFVRSIIEIARSVGTRIIGEGVETKGELETLRRLGVELIQGYFLQRPQPVPAPIDMDSLHTTQKKPLADYLLARSLISSRNSYHSDTSVANIVRTFQDNVALNSLAIVDDGKTVGVVHRKRFLTEMSRPFAMDLNARRPIRDLMEDNFLQIDGNFRIEQVSRLVTDRARLHAEEDFVVTERGKFNGMGQVVDLLRQITEIQVKTARHANPLTMLPGNVPIGDCVDRLLQEGQSFVVSYFDLDHFKPFNDAYGYAKGDAVLLMLAELLQKYVHHDSDFIGHIGGDDFIAVTSSGDWMDKTCSVVNEFERRVKKYYSDEDVMRGGIRANDRFGETRFFGFVSISVGSIAVEKGQYHSFQEVSADLVNVKQSAKRSETANIALLESDKLSYYSCRKNCASILNQSIQESVRTRDLPPKEASSSH